MDLLKLFFWSGGNHYGEVYGNLQSLLAVEEALKAQGRKVVILSTRMGDMRPYHGYEQQFNEWKQFEA